MFLTKKSSMPITVLVIAFFALVMIFGSATKADAAEYKMVDCRSANKAYICNGVKFCYSIRPTDNSTDIVVWSFGDKTVTLKQYWNDYSKGNQYMNSVYTNGRYVYYAVGKMSSGTTNTSINKMNLSTGKVTTVKTFSNNNNISIAGIYGKRIYYLTNKGNAKNNNGALKCYETGTKKTTTVNSVVTEVPGGNGRYMYMWINNSGCLNIYDTHTAKLVRTIKTWPSGTYGMQIIGTTSSHVVLAPYISGTNLNTNVYRVNNSGVKKTTLVSGVTGLGFKNGYLYYKKGNVYYKMKISDKTKTAITSDEFWQVLN